MKRPRSPLGIDIALLAALAAAPAAACDEPASPVEPTDEPPADEQEADRRPGAGDDESESDDQTVRLSPEARERIEVRVESYQTGRLDSAIEAPARVRHDVDRVTHLSPLVDGQVTDVRASLGDEVEADQVVAVMRSAELGDARAAVGEAEATFEVAEKGFERHRRLRDRGIVSEREFLEARGRLEEARASLEAARSRLESLGVQGGEGPSYPLRSGIAGTVVQQEVTRGETKRPGDELFVVADRSEVWVVGHVYESDIHHVERGMEAAVTLEAHPDERWTGSVEWVGEMLEEEARVLPVRVTLANDEGLLRPGMFGRMELMPASIEDPVALVPVDAVQRVGGREVVFVPGGESGSYRVRPVETGAESDGRVEIRSGLEDDDRLVTAGAFELKTAMRSK